MKRVVALVAIAAAAVVPAAAGAQPRLTIAPNPARFGDIVTATVAGAGDAAVDFGPFAVLREHASGSARTFVLQCLDPECVPGTQPRRIRLPPVTVGGHATAWPLVVVGGRATEAEVARPAASFRRQTAVPAPRYRIAPGPLRVALLAVAVVLAAAGVALLAPRRRRSASQRTPLERAIALVRASLRRDASDRRRALDLLARALGDDPQAQDATALAWSKPDPTPERAAEAAAAAEPRS